jgi:chromosome segregation ATPase
MRLRKAAEEQLDGQNVEHTEKLKIFEQQKSDAEAIVKQLEKSLEEARSQNNTLLSQLEVMGDRIEKAQAARVDEAGEGEADEGEDAELTKMRKDISDLRETMKYLNAERNMTQAQLDASRRASDRERAEAAVVKRSLDDARAELKVLQESTNRDKEGSDEAKLLKDKLRAAVEQSQLLGESNSHLREELDKVQKMATELEKERDSFKEAAEPAEKRRQDLQVEKEVLLVENASLFREIEDWKNRINGLTSKFGQVSKHLYFVVV